MNTALQNLLRAARKIRNSGVRIFRCPACRRRTLYTISCGAVHCACGRYFRLDSPAWGARADADPHAEREL